MLTYVLRAALLPLGRHRRHQTKAKEAQLRARSPSGVNPPNPSVVQRLHLATLPLRRRGLLLQLILPFLRLRDLLCGPVSSLVLDWRPTSRPTSQ